MPFIGDNGKNTKTPNAGAAGLDKPLIKSAQQAASDAPKAPKFLSTYTLKLNNGSTYDLTKSQVDWIKKLYQSTAADAYQIDAQDQIRKANGQLPTSFEKSYKTTTLDQKLYQQGLPSEKFIEQYIGAYLNWYGDGKTYSFDKPTSDYVADKFKSSWEYEYTLEDQKRKASGQMPLAIESKYGDNRRDYELMQQGLPPELMLSDYVGAYETIQTETKRKDEFYLAVTKLALANSADPYNVDDATKQAAFDAVISSSDWADVAALYDEPTQAATDGTVDTIEEYQKKWSAQKKEQKSSDEPTVSYADFSTQFLPYKSRAMKEDTVTRNAVVAAQTKKTSEVVSNATAKEYIGIRKEEDPAIVFAEMYESGVPLTQINNAKKHWKTLTSDVAKDKAIEAAFATVQAQYNADRAQAATPIEDQYSASANAGRYSKENIAAYQAEQKAVRQAKRFGDKAIKNGVVKDYDQGATSTINANDAEKIFKSHLVYDDKGKPTKESIELATNMMYEAGATTSVVLEVGKRAGMKSNFLSKDYWENQLAIEQQATQKAFDQTNGFQSPKVVEENKPRYDIKGFDQSFADVVAERDLAQRKELIDASYKANVESGNMTSAEFYNAVRRAGWGDTIDVAKDSESYYTDVYAPKFAKNGQKIQNWNELDAKQQADFTANFESGKDLNPEIHKTTEEIVQGALSRTFMEPAMAIAVGGIGWLDKSTAKASGRTDAWELTKLYADVQNESQGVSSNQSIGAAIANYGSTVAGQLVRMYTVSQIGSGVLSMFGAGANATGASAALSKFLSTAPASSAKWINGIVKASSWAIKSSPFIATSMGSYYAEAIQNGATVQQAVPYANVCGIMEGALEAVGTEMWLGRMFGGQSIAKGIIDAGKAVFKANAIVPKALLIRLVSSALGNATEEFASYAISIGMQRATYDKDAQFSWAEAGNQALMGAFIGLFGAGLNAGADTQMGILSEFAVSKAGQEWIKSEENSVAFNDMFVMAKIADTVPEQSRAAMRMQENGKSVAEVSAMVRDIDQHSRQMDAGQKQYADDIAKIDAELGKKQDAVAVLSAKMEQAAADKSAAGMKKWSKIAEQLQVAQQELDVEQKQAQAKRTERTAAHTETQEQHKIAISKAQESLKGVAVSITEAFDPQISQIRDLVRDKVVAVPNEIAQEILTKMNAAHAGKLLDYIQTKNDLYQRQYESVTGLYQTPTSPAQPATDAQTVQATTDQPTAENAYTGAEMASDMQNATTDSAGNIKSEATPANPAETMGLGGISVGAMTSKKGLSEGRTAISQFFTNTLSRMAEADHTTEVDNSMQVHGEAFVYDVVSERESLAKAQERLAKGITPEIIEELRTKNVWTGVDVDVAYAIRAAYVEYKNRTGDADPYSNWVMLMTDRIGEGGRAMQANAKYTRDTPEQAVVMMQRNVKKAENDAKTKNKKTTDSIKQDRDAVKKNKKAAEDDTANDIGELVLNEKKRKPRTPKAETEPSEPLPIEQLLANKIIKAAQPKTSADVTAVKQILSDLFGKAKQSPITPQDNRVVETPEEKTSRIYWNKERYAELWQKAQDIVFEMAGDDAALKEALSSYFVNSQIPDAPQQLLNSLYQKAKKAVGADIKNIIVKSNGIQEETRSKIIDYLMQTVNLDADGALALSLEINRLFNQEMGKRTANYLRSLYKDKYKSNGVVKSALDKLEEMSNATAFIDAEYADKIEAKLDEQLKRVLVSGGIRLSSTQDKREATQSVSMGDIVARGAEYTAREMQAYLSRVAGINVTEGDMNQIMEAARLVFADAVEGEKVAFRKRLMRTNEKKATDIDKITAFERAIRAINLGAYDSTTIDATVLAANKLPALTAEDARRVMQLVEMSEQQTDEYEKARYHGMAAKIIANTEPVTFGDKFRSIQRIMMLLNPRTMTRNVAGNAINLGLEWSKDYAGVPIDMIVSLFTGQRSTTIARAKYEAYASGFKQGLSETYKDIKYGVHTGKDIGKFEMSTKDVWSKAWMNFADELVKYGLSAGDHAFFMGARAEFMKAEEVLGHDLNSEEVQSRITKLALERVFQGNSELAKRIKATRNAWDGKTLKFGSLLLPFVETPSNIADRLIDYGAGGIRALISLTQSSKTGVFDQKTFVDQMARGLTGKALMIVGYAAAKLGLINLSPKDEEERQMMKNAGITPYSLQLGDMSVAIDWASPTGSILLMGAALSQLGTDSSALNILYDGSKVLVNSFFNSTLLGNVVNLLDGNRGDVAGGLSNFAMGSTTQFIPAILGAIARVTDPYERDTYDPSLLLRTGKKLLSYFPGIRQLLPIKYGTDGMPVESNYGSTFAGRVANTLLNPALTDQRSDDPVNSEVYRLFKAGYTGQMLPVAEKSLSATVNREKKTVELTPEQRNEYQQIIGKVAYEAAYAVVNSSSYDSMTDAQKANALSERISDAVSDARADYKHTIGLN